MNKKILSLMIIMYIISVLFTGCGKKAENTQRPDADNEGKAFIGDSAETQKSKKDYAYIVFCVDGNDYNKFETGKNIEIKAGQTIKFDAIVKSEYSNQFTSDDKVIIEVSSDAGTVNEEKNSILFTQPGSFKVSVSYSINGENKNIVDVDISVGETVLGNNPINWFSDNKVLKTSSGKILAVNQKTNETIYIGTMSDMLSKGRFDDETGELSVADNGIVWDISGLNEYNGTVYFSAGYSIYKLSSDYSKSEVVATKQDKKGTIKHFTIINGAFYYYVCTSTVQNKGYFEKMTLDGKVKQKSEDIYDVRYVTFKDGYIMFGGHGDENSFGIYRMTTELDSMEWVSDIIRVGKYSYCNNKVYSINSVGLMEYEKGSSEYKIIYEKPVSDMISFNNKLYYISEGSNHNHEILYEYDPVTQKHKLLCNFQGGTSTNIDSMSIVDSVIFAHRPGVAGMQLYDLSSGQFVHSVG